MPFRLQVPLAEAVEHRAWRHARLAVLDAVGRGEAVAVLGPAGSGKTMLLRSVARALEALGWQVAQPGPGTVPEEAEVVLLDEAGHLAPAELAALARRGRPFVLAAPPGFAARLAALPRPMASVTLGAMAPDEVARFVAARLAAAGRPTDLFTPEALEALARHSRGMVRLVLVLAGAALFAAEGEGAPRVTQADVDEAAAMRLGDPEEPEPEPEPESEPAPEVPPPPPLQAAPPPRVRLAGATPRPRVSRARLWWRRATLGLAAAGLAMAAGAVVLVPRLMSRRAAPPAKAPVGLAAPEPPVQAPPAAPPPSPPAAPPPTPSAAPPAPVVEPPPLEPAQVAEPEPLPLPPVPVPPPAPMARPVPRPRIAAVPPPVAAPLPEAQVAPSPWSVGRLPAPAPAPAGEGGRLARIVTREPANIRRAPGIASPVVRVTSAGMVLRVFDQRGPWVQVGDSAPWGWVHAAVVERAS